jgi:flagellar biogenesis protein FliO
MAPTGFLLTIALALGADPGGADPFSPLREPPLHELSEAELDGGAESVVEAIPEPAQFSPLVRPAAGWSVSDSPAAIPAQHPPAGNLQPAMPEPPPQPQEAAPQALKLTPPTKAPAGAEKTPPSASGAITSVISSLAVVLGLFFVVVWLAKRNSPKGAALLPAEVIEVLGRAPLTPRQQMHVVRFGNKLLLVSLSPAGAEPLAEIDDPVEVERVLTICQELQQGSITETFRQVFSQFANEPAQEGFAGRDRADPALHD